jgi:uncharacterized membrane protein
MINCEEIFTKESLAVRNEDRSCRVAKNMYNNKSQHSLFDAAIPAAVGAGVVTSFAMSQGQHPALAIAITMLVTLFAVICDRFNLI